MRRVILTLLAMLLAACEAPSTSHTDIVRAVQQGALIVDVRTPEEFATAHYPGAINVPHDAIVSGLSTRAVTPDSSIVLYCRSGNRSRKAEAALRGQGFSNTLNAGGLSDMLAATGQSAVVP